MKRVILALTLSALASAGQAQTETSEPVNAPPTWQLATPYQWERPGRVGEPVDVQLRVSSPAGVTASYPCTLSEPPSVKVTRLSEGGADEPLWLTLTPVWDAPTCEGGVLVLPEGQRMQYRANLNGLPAGDYMLSGFWFGGEVGNTLGPLKGTLRLE